MNTSFPSSKIRPNQQVGGGFGFFDEIGYEMETPSFSSVAKGLGGIVEDIFSIGSDLTESGSESKSESTLSIGGQTEIDFNRRQTEAEAKLKQKDKDDQKKAFYQAMEQNRLRTQQAKDNMLIEEEINDISLNLSTAEKNQLLHYQAGYKDKSVYQRAELRRKIIEQRKMAEKQEKQTSIPSPAKKASALDAAYEGGSGTQGSGTANLSAQATG